MVVGKEQGHRPSVLLVRLSSLGDIVQALPLAALLIREGHSVGWLVESRFAGLAALVDLPIEWHVWNRGWSSTLGLRGLRGRYDVVCDVQGNWKSALCARAIAGRDAWRPARANLREPWSALIPSRHAVATHAPHILDRSLTVLASALKEPMDADRLPGPPFLQVGQDLRVRVGSAIARWGVEPDQPFAVLVLGPDGDPRSWPLARVLELEGSLEVPHLLLCGPAESSLRLDPDLPVLRQQAGQLADLVGLGNLLADTGGVALGHDGGAMHVLRASGARTRFLFGPQDPARTGPYREDVIRVSEPLPCQPCLRRTCKLREGNLCMDKIPAEVARREVEACLDIG